MIAWRAVAALQLRPLVIARCHAEGSDSACPAFLPQLLAYSDHQQGALDELVDFLSYYFAELSPDALQKFLTTEEATMREVSVVIPREDLPRGQRIRTPIAVPVIEVAAHNGAKWLLLPTLAQATYLNARADQTLKEAARNEISTRAPKFGQAPQIGSWPGKPTSACGNNAASTSATSSAAKATTYSSTA